MFYTTRSFPLAPSMEENYMFGPHRRRGGRCHGAKRHVHPAHLAAFIARSSAATQFMETETDVRLSLDLPGVKAEDIDLVLNEGVLSLSATRRQSFPATAGDEEKSKHRIEKTFSVDRSSIDDTKPITANLFNGVLQIVIPKAAKKNPVRIVVTEDEPMEEEPVANKEDEANKQDNDKMMTDGDEEKTSSVEAVAVETVQEDAEDEEEIVVVDVKDISNKATD